MAAKITPQARADLLQLADYIARDSLDAAIQFLDAAENAFRQLTQMPEIGSACRFRSPQARGIRVWPIRGFENDLIFYRPTTEGIDVVRLIHRARYAESLLADNDPSNQALSQGPKKPAAQWHTFLPLPLGEGRGEGLPSFETTPSGLQQVQRNSGDNVRAQPHLPDGNSGHWSS